MNGSGWVVAMFVIGFILGSCAMVIPGNVVVVSGTKGSVLTVNYKDVVYRLEPLATDTTERFEPSHDKASDANR
jgi:hypothetical protein